MKKSLFGALMLIGVSGLAGAQAVRLTSHNASMDVWGQNFDPGHKITFKGKVTGIEAVSPTGTKESEITLLVRNRDGGGTAIVDLGPGWFVNHQSAKIKVGDYIQVTGSKTLVDGKGIILSSMIRIGAQGGPVLALRRDNGRAYWVGTEVAQNQTPPSGSNVVAGTFQGYRPYTYNSVTYQSAILSTPNGAVNVDLGPQWYYGAQNVSYNIGDNVSVVVGPNPIMVTPGLQILPTYSLYQGPNVYNLRAPNGAPFYNWNQ